MRIIGWIATIACVVKWISKRTKDPEVESSNPCEYQKMKKTKKGNSWVIRGKIKGGEVGRGVRKRV